MGFNESHSAVENVVVITGKLISPPYGLKAGLNSESRYQQFYFLLLLLGSPPSACLSLSLSLLLSLSFNLVFSPSHTIHCHCSLLHIFKAFGRNRLVVLKSNCSAKTGGDIASPCGDPLAKKESQGCSDPLWIHHVTASLKCGCMIEGKRLQLISLLLSHPSAVVLTLAAQRITSGTIKRVLMPGPHLLRD